MSQLATQIEEGNARLIKLIADSNIALAETINKTNANKLDEVKGATAKGKFPKWILK